MFHHRYDLGGHETGRPDGYPRPRHLGHLYRPANVGDLHTPPGAARVDLEPLHAGPDVDEDLDAIALHVPTLPRRCKIGSMRTGGWSWPAQADELEMLQSRLASAAAAVSVADPWTPSIGGDLLGGCFVASRRGAVGPGRGGDWLWAAAVVWRQPEPDPSAPRARTPDRHLRGATEATGQPRRADDVLAQAVVKARAPSPYLPGLLAARDGPVLADALSALGVCPEVVLLDAAGADHPRRAGLAVHLGAALSVPTIGVTRRPLVATGRRPDLRRGERSPLTVGGRCVAYWVCTRDGTQPLVAHAGWRTTPETAARVVLDASTAAARTPVPLQEARRVAREARGLRGTGLHGDE
jgi:deoxyribonuclease V